MTYEEIEKIVSEDDLIPYHFEKDRDGIIAWCRRCSSGDALPKSCERCMWGVPFGSFSGDYGRVCGLAMKQTFNNVPVCTQHDWLKKLLEII